MLSAGTNVEWLRDDLGLIATSAESHDVAAMCDDTDGVVYVPALLGLGTPTVGLRRPRHAARHHPRHRTSPRGARRAGGCRPPRRGPHRRRPYRQRGRHPHRAHRRRDERESHVRPGVGRRRRLPDRGVPGRRVDDDRCRVHGRSRCRRVRRLDDLDALWRPARVVEPADPSSHEQRREHGGADALERAGGWHAELSALDF